MTESAPAVRLRQAVLVAQDLEPVASMVQSALGLGEPYRDPRVATFGLVNVVMPIGDASWRSSRRSGRAPPPGDSSIAAVATAATW